MIARVFICRLAFLLAGCTALALLTGCPPVRPLTSSGMDMFSPVAMRLHPLSRLVVANNVGQVEAHVEFTDQMGDVTKGVGRIDLDLFAYDEGAIFNHAGKLLDHWTSDISTPDANKTAWDAITRTYVFRHDAPSAAQFAPGRRYIVAVAYTLPNNQQHHDQAVLTVK